MNFGHRSVPVRDTHRRLVRVHATAFEQPHRSALTSRSVPAQRLQRPAASQLPALFLRSGGLGHRHLDAKPCHVLAGPHPHVLGRQARRWSMCCSSRPPSSSVCSPECVADRVPKRSLLVVTQSIAALSSAALAIPDLDRPYRSLARLSSGADRRNQQLVRYARPASVRVRNGGGQEDLPNAIALNSTLFNMGRLVGPALAGLVLGVFGRRRSASPSTRSAIWPSSPACS